MERKIKFDIRKGEDIGSCRLCRHNFENNWCAWEFENIPGIIGNLLRIMSDIS